MKCVFTVDVEDWFHILDLQSTPDLAAWDGLPSRVERNFCRLMDLFAERNVQTTCFFLGWIARRYGHLVRLALSRGHEVASHGYSHQLAYTMPPARFLADAREAKRSIEDAAGVEVLGYRASGFSVTQATPWFFDALAEAGYRYDSSVFPAARAHGGLPGGRREPHVVESAQGVITEFPVTVTTVLSRPVCLFGGGYLRLAPWPLIRREAHRIADRGRPVVFYVHPREIDPDQPRLPMGIWRHFKCYVNLKTTAQKIQRVLSEFEFVPFRDLIADAPSSTRSSVATTCR